MFECAWHTAATQWHKRRWEKLGGRIRTSFTLSWEDVGSFFFFFLFFSIYYLAASGLSFSAAGGILVCPPGIEPMSPVLQGGFLTSGPSGKSLSRF